MATRLDAVDFQLVSQWKIDEDGERYGTFFGKPGPPKWIVDTSTGNRYLNEPREVLRSKHLALATICLPISVICSTGVVAKRIFTCVCNCMRPMRGFEKRYHTQKRDCTGILIVPFAWIGQQLSALYGFLLFPNDGRKLYNNFERLQYGMGRLAPCFDPDAKKHLLGGDIESQGAW